MIYHIADKKRANSLQDIENDFKRIVHSHHPRNIDNNGEK